MFFKNNSHFLRIMSKYKSQEYFKFQVSNEAIAGEDIVLPLKILRILLNKTKIIQFRLFCQISTI